MSEPKLFNCPTCGASLPVPDAASVKCEYCGSNVVVPIELRTKEGLKSTNQRVQSVVIQNGEASKARSPILTTIFILLCIGLIVPVILLSSGVFTLTSRFSLLSGSNEEGGMVEVTSIVELMPVEPAGPQSKTLLQFGGEGSGAGQFDDPREIALDLDGNIYVANYGDGRVQKFDTEGKFLYLINVEPDQNDNIYIPAMATDYAGKLYVVRSGDILIYDTADGSPTGSIPGVFPTTHYDALAISPANELYAIHSTASGQDLIKMDANGQTLWRQEDFIEQIDKDARIAFLKLAVDGLGNSYIISMNGESVYKFSPEGTYIDRFGSKGDKAGQFQSMQNISVDGQGMVYIIDTKGIHIFDQNGSFIKTVPGDPTVGVLRDAAIDDEGNIIVVTIKGQVVKYTSPLNE
jgi:DNA-binding beta-propeller fold protein YncE